MTNRLLVRMKELEAKRAKAFCAFLTLGYPDLRATAALAREFDKAGVDVLELGFPFSDPMADGPTIQYSSEQALKKNIRIEDSFALVSSLRKQRVAMPVIFFTYFNPVLSYGLEKFARHAAAAGFDGLIVPDLPPEEEPGLAKACRRYGISRIYLVAPTTEAARAGRLARESQGFIYYVSLRGVTGARRALPDDIRRNLKSLKRQTAKPVLIGFGVSTPAQGRALAQMSQGVIVGSAIVEKIRRAKGRVEPAVRFVRQMVRSVKGKA